MVKNLAKNSIFTQKIKIFSKFQILVKIPNFWLNYKFSLKLVKNLNFNQKYKFFPEIEQKKRKKLEMQILKGNSKSKPEIEKRNSKTKNSKSNLSSKWIQEIETWNQNSNSKTEFEVSIYISVSNPFRVSNSSF